MNTWIVSPNVTDNTAHLSEWKRLIDEKGMVFMGYGPDHQLGSMFNSKVQQGDIVLIAQGANKQKQVLICGMVCSDASSEPVEGMPTDEIVWHRQLKNVVRASELEQLRLDFKDGAFGDAQLIQAIHILKPDSNKVDARNAFLLKQAVLEKAEQEKLLGFRSILELKKQLILQGPPGTGKTRLAKKLAQELTKPKRIGSPLDSVNRFFQQFDKLQPEVVSNRQKHNLIISQFQQRFPITSIRQMSLEDYALGGGNKNSFCWWIEKGLRDVGKYSPGSARAYLLYRSNEDGEYRRHGKLLININDNQEALEKITSVLADFVVSRDYNTARTFFGDSFLLKVLTSYYPDEYFPINSIQCLENALKLFGVDYIGLSPIEMNLKVQNLFEEINKKYGTDVTSLEFMKYLFDTFNMKGELILEPGGVSVKGEVKLVQFHPAYSYEDFVRGISVKSAANSQISYAVEDRILAKFAGEAEDNPSVNYVLIIDEINRANLPSVLGELIYALEYRFDPENPTETTVDSLYELDGDRELRLPKNLIIIGTMNSADRSVGHIDYAIRRRFAFVDVQADENVIDLQSGKSLFAEVKALFIDPESDEHSIYLSNDIYPKDVMPGHSYFMASDVNKLQLRLEYEIKPLLMEYVKDGILNQNAIEIVTHLQVD